MHRTAIILACFFIPMAIGTTNCFAQQHPFVHYTPKDGLINSRVRKAYQDSKGRMYFLTFDGLSVFDGARFKNYTVRNGLSSNLVNDVLEVGDDSLLVATNSGYYVNVLVRGKVGVLNPNPPSPLINQFYRHEDNNIYMSSDDGFFILENRNIRELKINNHQNLLNLRCMTGIGNWLILSTNEMNSWQGIYLYDIKNNRINDSLACYLIDKDKNNNIWVSFSNELFILNPASLKKGRVSLIPPPGAYAQAKNYTTTNIAFNKKHIWFLYRDKDYRNVEILRIDDGGNLLRMPLPSKAIPSVITNILVDKENTVWLCNDGEGVFKLVHSPLQVFENPFGDSVKGFIDNAYYWNGTTWYNTNTNALFRKSGNTTKEFNCNITSTLRIFYYDADKLFAYDTKNVYEGSLNEQKSSIYFHPIITLPDGDYFGKRMLIDPYGNILTTRKSGLTVWRNNKAIFHLPTFPKVDIVDDISFDKNNLLWVQNRFTGINVFSLFPKDSSNYLQRVYHFEPKQIMGSPRCLVIDKAGLIWIGTRSNGLFAYKHDGNQLNKLYQFDAASGLTDNFVTSLACDSLNNIIVGTQTGLDRILIAENSFKVENLTKSTNFFSFIYQVWADANNAYARCYSGVLLQLSPPLKENTGYTPELLLEEIKVNAQTLAVLRDKFRYKENNLSFLVAAPSFIDEKQVAYSYLLEGSGNEQWSDTSSANAAINLTHLSAGKYSLKIRAFFPSSVYKPAEFHYSFEIIPPWWQTWWFKTIVAVLVSAFLVFTFRFYYKRKMEKRLGILEKQQVIEKERTRIATDMHDDLGAGLSRIKFLSETISIKKQQQQPIEEEVNKIREYSHEMIDKMGEIVWALNEKNDTLNDLLSYTRVYAVEYLTQNGIECKTEIPDAPPSVFVSGEFRRNIFLTIKEALHNVVKHSQATEVKLSVTANHFLEIQIKDNGIGLDKNAVRLFSNGLENMEKRLKEIGGLFTISNTKGTLVKLKVLLPA